ncbi:MAG: DUF2911 domain-containing protein [Microscillaceae bacterium]|jgi:hypothetical protein|nr:DUF2911 domain-containing protein [Microscillaceae bacterium]
MQKIRQLYGLFLSLLWLLGSFLPVSAQFLTVPPNGGNKKATVGERIGVTDIMVEYHRPGVKGREGKIWGQLVPYGFTDLGFGPRKPAPWRAGANENTIISFSTDVKIEGRDLPAGTYGLHIAVYERECTVIFSKNHTAWGSYFYKESDDALRVQVRQEGQERSVEWLKYEFIDQTENAATLALFWERWKIPFKIEVDVQKQVINSMRRELESDKGFVWQTWYQAADYCLQYNTNLNEALQWAEVAVNAPYVGEKNFLTLSTKANILKKLGKNVDSEVVMKEALTYGNAVELHTYGRQLIAEKKGKEALEVFKLNAQKNNGAWPTNVGLARGYAAVGDYTNAIKYAKLAKAQAPSPQEGANLDELIKKLQNKEPVN